MKKKYISGKTFLLEEMFPKLNIFCMVYRLSRNFIDLNSLKTYLNHYFGIVSLLQKLPRSNIYILFKGHTQDVLSLRQKIPYHR